MSAGEGPDAPIRPGILAPGSIAQPSRASQPDILDDRSGRRPLIPRAVLVTLVCRLVRAVRRVAAPGTGQDITRGGRSRPAARTTIGVRPVRFRDLDRSLPRCRKVLAVISASKTLTE